jgi:hypothetical protein
MDFTWFWFIGRAKLGLTFKETGRLTLRMFGRLYQHYKNDYDLEMRLWKADKTYADAHRMSQQDEEWF